MRTIIVVLTLLAAYFAAQNIGEKIKSAQEKQIQQINEATGGY